MPEAASGVGRMNVGLEAWGGRWAAPSPLWFPADGRGLASRNVAPQAWRPVVPARGCAC